MPKSIYYFQYLNLQRALISARKSAGLTQRQLADLIDKPQSFVAKLELGERRLDVVEFIVICQALDIDPCAVLTRLTTKE